MTQRYRPDTCPCVLLLSDDSSTFVDWEVKCDLHKALNDQALVNAVAAHNKSIGPLAQNSNPTPTQVQDSHDLKVAERIRVVALGPVVKNT